MGRVLFGDNRSSAFFGATTSVVALFYFMEEKYMALIKCPECGVEISDKALTCPKCGYHISINVGLEIGIDMHELKREAELCEIWTKLNEEHSNVISFLSQEWKTVDEMEAEFFEEYSKYPPKYTFFENIFRFIFPVFDFIVVFCIVFLFQNYLSSILPPEADAIAVFCVLPVICLWIIHYILCKKLYKKVDIRTRKKRYKKELDEYINKRNTYFVAKSNAEKRIVEISEMIKKVEKDMRTESFIIPESYWNNGEYIYLLVSQKRAKSIYEAIAIIDHENEIEEERNEREMFYSDLEFDINSTLSEIKETEQTRLREERENQKWNDLSNAAILYGLSEISEK